MNTLFDIELVYTPDAPKGETCRHCVNRYKHQYNNTLYCGKQRQRGTSYGHKKIKAGNPACYMFEKNNPTKECDVAEDPVFKNLKDILTSYENILCNTNSNVNRANVPGMVPASYNLD